MIATGWIWADLFSIVMGLFPFCQGLFGNVFELVSVTPKTTILHNYT
jgi:hypothetical protein